MACWWNKIVFWKPFALCFFCNMNNKYLSLICGHVTNNTRISSLDLQSTPQTTLTKPGAYVSTSVTKWKAKTSSNFFKRRQCPFFFSSSQFCASAKPQLRLVWRKRCTWVKERDTTAPPTQLKRPFFFFFLAYHAWSRHQTMHLFPGRH